MTNERTATNAIQREYLPNGHYKELVSYKDFQKKRRRSGLLKILSSSTGFVDLEKVVGQIAIVHLIVAVVVLLIIDVLFASIIGFAFWLETLSIIVKLLIVPVLLCLGGGPGPVGNAYSDSHLVWVIGHDGHVHGGWRI